MSQVPIGGNLYVGGGKVYLDRYVSGVRTGNEFFIGNVDSLEITMTTEKIRKYSSAEAARPLLAEVIVRQEAEVTIQFNERIAKNLEYFLMGDASTLAQTGASVVDAQLLGVKQGSSRFVGHRNISAVVVRDAGGVTPLVAGVDYNVEATEGRLYIIVGGGIADDDDIEVDYTYATIALEKIQMQKQNSIQAYLRFAADPAHGPDWNLEIWKISLTPEGALQLITDDFAASQLKGAILSDAVLHPTEPYGIAYKVA